MSLSHIRRTVQPDSLSRLLTSVSRSRFRAILAIHQSALVGNWSRGSASPRTRQALPCQKSPSTKTAILSPCQAMSGVPGTCLGWSRYRSPRPCSADRRAISGRVFLFRTAAIIRVVTAGSRRPRLFALGLLVGDSAGFGSDGCRITGESLPECAQPFHGVHLSASMELLGGVRPPRVHRVPP